MRFYVIIIAGALIATAAGQVLGASTGYQPRNAAAKPDFSSAAPTAPAVTLFGDDKNGFLLQNPATTPLFPPAGTGAGSGTTLGQQNGPLAFPLANPSTTILKE